MSGPSPLAVGTSLHPQGRPEGGLRPPSGWGTAQLGYGALWIGEAFHREPLTAAAVLLSATKRMVVATGIANIWARGTRSQ
jgi:hypothetical protein